MADKPTVTDERAIGIETPDEAAVPHTPPAGDYRDDDGLVLDELFQANPNPTIPAFPDHVGERATYADMPKQTTRLITRQYAIGQELGDDLAEGTLLDPIQVLPADPRRKYVSIRGRFAHSVVDLTSPAAGAGLGITLPDTFPYYDIESLAYQLTTDATVANRIQMLHMYRDAADVAGTARYNGSGGGINQPASQSWAHIWAAHDVMVSGGYSVYTRNVIWPRMRPGEVLQATVGNIAAGDQISKVRLTLTSKLFRVASAKSDVYGAPDLDGFWESDCHTGEVWVYAPDATPGFIDVQSVTE